MRHARLMLSLMRFCASSQCVKCILKPGMDATMDTKGKGLAGVQAILKEA